MIRMQLDALLQLQVRKTDKGYDNEYSSQKTDRQCRTSDKRQ